MHLPMRMEDDTTRRRLLSSDQATLVVSREILGDVFISSGTCGMARLRLQLSRYESSSIAKSCLAHRVEHGLDHDLWSLILNDVTGAFHRA